MPLRGDRVTHLLGQPVHLEETTEILDRLGFSPRVAGAGDDAVVHGEIAQVIATPDGSLFIIDWDEIVMAPKERDLMFTVHNDLGGAPVQTRETTER